MDHKRIHLLLIWDSLEETSLLCERLAGAGNFSFDMLQAGQLEPALDVITEKEIDAVLLVVSKGPELILAELERLRQSLPKAAIIVLTGSREGGVAAEAVPGAVRDFLPADMTDARRLATSIAYIAGRKNAERQLLAAIHTTELERAKVEAIIASIGDGLEIVDRNFIITYQNQTSRDLLGDHTGELCYKAYHNEDNVCMGCPVAMCFADGRIHNLERKLAIGGRTLHLEVTASPVRDTEGNIIAGIEVVRDITKRRQAEEALRESEENYRDLFENASDMIQGVTADGRFLFTNRAWCRTLQYDEEDLAKLTIFDIFHPDAESRAREFFTRAIAGQEAEAVHEIELVAKNGAKVIIEGSFHPRFADGKPVSCRGIFRNITERKRSEAARMKMQSQLILAQKLEAIGTLAGGVAHDFNNLLTAIKGYNELAMKSTEEDDKRYGYLQAIGEACNRAVEIIRQLLFFSRQQAMEFKRLDINRIVLPMVEMLDRFTGRTIVMHMELEEKLWPVSADEGSIEQIVISLVFNARDAMPEGGTLTIRTANVTVDKEYCKIMPTARPGNFICLTVADTGYGMDKELIDHIFDPFFTTKEVGKGTGLGLSGIYGIIKQHRGWIEVWSMPGRGARFSVFFEAI